MNDVLPKISVPEPRTSKNPSPSSGPVFPLFCFLLGLLPDSPQPCSHPGCSSLGMGVG